MPAWFSKNLGDAVMAFNPTQEIMNAFTPLRPSSSNQSWSNWCYFPSIHLGPARMSVSAGSPERSIS